MPEYQWNTKSGREFVVVRSRCHMFLATRPFNGLAVTLPCRNRCSGWLTLQMTV